MAIRLLTGTILGLTIFFCLFVVGALYSGRLTTFVAALLFALLTAVGYIRISRLQFEHHWIQLLVGAIFILTLLIPVDVRAEVGRPGIDFRTPRSSSLQIIPTRYVIVISI